MSKKTRLMEEANYLLYQQNNILKSQQADENELKKHELSVKDRVDISLKEYNETKEELKETKEALASANRTISKIFNAFRKQNADYELVEKFMNGEFDCKIVNVSEDPATLKKNVYVVYAIDYYKM